MGVMGIGDGRPKEIQQLEDNGYYCKQGVSSQSSLNDLCYILGQQTALSISAESCGDGENNSFTFPPPACINKIPNTPNWYCVKLEDPGSFKRGISCKYPKKKAEKVKEEPKEEEPKCKPLSRYDALWKTDDVEAALKESKDAAFSNLVHGNCGTGHDEDNPYQKIDWECVYRNSTVRRISKALHEYIIKLIMKGCHSDDEVIELAEKFLSNAVDEVKSERDNDR